VSSHLAHRGPAASAIASAAVIAISPLPDINREIFHIAVQQELVILRAQVKRYKETAMNLKVYYRITQDRAGIPMDYTGARHFVVPEGQVVEELAKAQLAADYQVPLRAVEIVSGSAADQLAARRH
jgi:hypothetical protein